MLSNRVNSSNERDIYPILSTTSCGTSSAFIAVLVKGRQLKNGNCKSDSAVSLVCPPSSPYICTVLQRYKSK